MPREADESWPFSHGQRVAVGATRPALLPSATGHDRHELLPPPAATCSCLPTSCRWDVAWPSPWAEVSALGKGCCVCSSIECSSPSCAVLGQGELLWGVTGVSRLTGWCWPRAGVLLLAGDELIFTEPQRESKMQVKTSITSQFVPTVCQQRKEVA